MKGVKITTGLSRLKALLWTVTASELIPRCVACKREPYMVYHELFLRLTLKEVLLCVHVRIVGDNVKWRPPSHHLKHQHAQSPPVHTEACEGTQQEESNIQSGVCSCSM